MLHGEITQLPFPISHTVFLHPLKLVYTDIWGPTPIPSVNDARYYVHFLDAFSKYTWIFLLQSKSQISNVFIQFPKMAELQVVHKLKVLQSDNTKEFLSFTNYLKS